jgi:hypothetical protein
MRWDKTALRSQFLKRIRTAPNFLTTLPTGVMEADVKETDKDEKLGEKCGEKLGEKLSQDEGLIKTTTIL